MHNFSIFSTIDMNNFLYQGIGLKLRNY